MSKNNRGEEIYKLLVHHFPETFPALEKIPKAVKHPGDQPIPPRSKETVVFSFDKEDSFMDMIKKFRENVGKDYLSTNDVVIQIFRETITEGYYVSSERNDDDLTWDESDYDDYYDSEDHYVAAVMGDACSIQIRAVIPNPNYQDQKRTYDHAMVMWKNHLDNYRNRMIKIGIVNRDNKALIHRATNEHRELWISAARNALGKDSDFLARKAELLENELNQLRKLIDNSDK